MARAKQIVQLIPKSLIDYIEQDLPSQSETPKIPDEQITPSALGELVQVQCRQIFDELQFNEKTELEELYTYVTLLARLVFHYSIHYSREDELRLTAISSILRIYIRTRMSHQFTAALLFLSSGDAKDKSNHFKALNVHPGLINFLTSSQCLSNLIPDDVIKEISLSACESVQQRVKKFPPTSGKQLANMSSLTAYLQNPGMIPPKWGAEMHDAYGIQEGFIKLGQIIYSGIERIEKSPAMSQVLSKLQEMKPELKANNLSFMLYQVKTFFRLQYSYQTVFTSRKQFQKARDEASYATVKQMTEGQLEFYILKILNSSVLNKEAMRDFDLKRSLRLRAAHAVYKHISHEQKVGVYKQAILNRQVQDLAHQAIDFLGRQLHRRPLNLLDLARARRDFLMLDNQMLSHEQLEKVPGFLEISNELNASDIQDDADLIQMALEESDIRIFEQIDQWINEQLLPFLDQRGGHKQNALNVAINACLHTITKMNERLEKGNYDISIRLGEALPPDGDFGEEDAVAGEEQEFDEFATPIMSMEHIDSARLAAAAARMIKLVSMDESRQSKKMLNEVKSFKLVNNQSIYDYSYTFFHKSLANFTNHNGEDLARWHHLAEQTRIYGQLLEILDTDFLYNESPRCLGAVEEVIRNRLIDNGRPPRTPADAENFVKLAIIVQKISRNNTILDIFARQEGGTITMPIIALLLMDKARQQINLKMLKSWVYLTGEVEKIYMKNTMSVNEQKHRPIEQHIVAKRLEVFLKQARI